MNNDYDRDDLEETLEVVVTEQEESSVGLFLLNTGETVIAQFTQSLSGLTYFFTDPRIVAIQSSVEDESTTQTTIVYSDWMPLSANREFTVSGEWIVCRTVPLDSLVQSYLGNTNG